MSLDGRCVQLSDRVFHHLLIRLLQLTLVVLVRSGLGIDDSVSNSGQGRVSWSLLLIRLPSNEFRSVTSCDSRLDRTTILLNHSLVYRMHASLGKAFSPLDSNLWTTTLGSLFAKSDNILSFGCMALRSHYVVDYGIASDWLHHLSVVVQIELTSNVPLATVDVVAVVDIMRSAHMDHRVLSFQVGGISVLRISR